MMYHLRGALPFTKVGRHPSSALLNLALGAAWFYACTQTALGQDSVLKTVIQDTSESIPVPDAESLFQARVRIPKALIVEAIDRDYEHTAAVDRVVLGTRSRGTAVCRGTVTGELVENSHGVEILCRVNGTVHSRTCGTNGPAVIHSRATTAYSAVKPILFNGHYFTARPATLGITTRLDIDCIESILPGLRGKIVRRVASRRADESMAAAEAVTKMLTQQELQQRIDAEFDQRIAALNIKLANRLSVLDRFVAAGKPLQIGSFEDCIEIRLGGGEARSISDEVGKQAIDTVELWLYLPQSDFSVPSLDALTPYLPTWLNAYLGAYSKPKTVSSRKLEFENRSQWIVLKLQD